MKIDFHYYLIYALAERSGFDRDLARGFTEASIIAYASQYVDDNNERRVIGEDQDELFEFDDGMTDDERAAVEIRTYQRFPWAVRIPETGNYFRPIMTQTISLKSFIPMFQKYLFVPFHFLPGDPEAIPEIRGRKNPYSTTANSANANALLQDALSREDLYGIGIALHTYADTWSHQNFSGNRDEWNAVRGTIIPDIGHAELFDRPDTISKTWVDSRLPPGERRIDNRIRAIAAVRAIFERLARYRSPNKTWEDVHDEFEAFIQARNMNERIDMVRSIYPDRDLDYRENEWLNKALEYDQRNREVVARKGFLDSHWYKFQVAAKRQIAAVSEMLTNIT